MVLLYSCGSNAQGQLGHGTVDDSSEFRPCDFACGANEHVADILNVAVGANHTLVLLEVVEETSDTSCREIWGSGDGRAGQLGQYHGRDDSGRTEFRKISLGRAAAGLGDYVYSAVAATWETSYAVLSCEGRSDVVVSFGSDQFGDLGIGQSSAAPLRGGSPAFHVVQFPTTALGSPTKVSFIVGGQRHVVVGLTDGVSTRVFGWGSARHGQLGPRHDSRSTFIALPTLLYDIPDSVSEAALGIQHTIFRLSSGELVPLGSNRKHQLEAASNASSVASIGATWNGTYTLVKEEDRPSVLCASGSNAHHQLGQGHADPVLAPVTVPLRQGLEVRQFDCGSEHVLVLAANSEVVGDRGGHQEVWGWGWNEHGNLGVGNTSDITSPTRIWPQDASSQGLSPQRVWAGLGTSWILFKE